MEYPKTTKAILMKEYGKTELADVPLPPLSADQVLIKVNAAPINPSDMIFIQGFYPTPKVLPCVPGFEGSGTVVLSGGDEFGKALLNKRVAFFVDGQIGTYSEYTIVRASVCVPLPENLDFDAAACSLVNPLTVLAMCEEVKAQNVKCVIQTAAASALGKMMVRYFKEQGIETINVIRREEQAKLLQNLGATIVLNSEAPDFYQDLEKLALEKQATICFDAIAGEISGKILKAMPKNSSVYVYGVLSASPCLVDPATLLFQNKSLKGFWLTERLSRKNLQETILFFAELQRVLPNSLASDIQGKFNLESFQQALHQYKTNMTQGKVLIKN